MEDEHALESLASVRLSSAFDEMSRRRLSDAKIHEGDDGMVVKEVSGVDEGTRC